jgi:hypothetical protein
MPEDQPARLVDDRLRTPRAGAAFPQEPNVRMPCPQLRHAVGVWPVGKERVTSRKTGVIFRRELVNDAVVGVLGIGEGESVNTRRAGGPDIRCMTVPSARPRVFSQAD